MGLTREEIKNTPEIVYLMLDKCILADLKTRLRKRLEEVCDLAIKAVEQEPCEDEYIKVPKKALKYRTAGMVAYNAEWLKKHFDMERAVICGSQEPSWDTVSRQYLLDNCVVDKVTMPYVPVSKIENAPPVKPQYTDAEIQKMQEMEQAELQKAYELGKAETGWIPVSERLPKDLEPVNITWVNHEPEPYYHDIKDKNFIATGIHYRGQWYWYSTTCADYLGEYGSNDIDKVDDAVEIVAWMPLPKPYEPQESEDEK